MPLENKTVTSVSVHVSRLPEGTVFGFSPPAIPGVGTAGGVTFVLENRAGKDVQFLSNNLTKFMAGGSNKRRGKDA
jgi:HAE1 family hydrophobic/amphiphilic exporter-1